MPRRSLFAATLFMIALTIGALSWAGWFKKAAERVSGSRSQGRQIASAQDVFGTEAGARHRRHQAAHWKYTMLRR